MESSSKFGGATCSNRLKSNEKLKYSENLDPNMSNPTPNICRLPPITKFGNISKKNCSKRENVNHAISPSLKRKKKIPSKFIVNKKFRKEEEICNGWSDNGFKNEEIPITCTGENAGIVDEGDMETINDSRDSKGENDELGFKRSRDRLLEEARESVPESGFGRVMHLVKAFEKLRMIPKFNNSKEKEVDEDKKLIHWALPGLQQPHKSLTPETLDRILESLIRQKMATMEASAFQQEHMPAVNRARESTASSGTFVDRCWKGQLKKATSQKPFMLSTEQRRRLQEDELIKKLEKEPEEEEKMRVPQDLPRTTNEPKITVKPPVKETTKTVKLVLNTGTRAMERAKFDHEIAQKMNLIEHYRVEMERHEKLAEEKEIKKLRKKLVPKAQSMPYFDRPFVPRRSIKHPTIPKEPKLHLPRR